MTDTNHPDTESPRHQLRESSTLVGNIVTHVVNMLRGEVDLLRAEVDQNVRKAGAAVGMIVAGVVVILVALNVLAAALVAALTELGIDAGWSALIVGAVFAVIAAILVKKGISDLKLTSLSPTRTAKNVRRDGEAVKKAI